MWRPWSINLIPTGDRGSVAAPTRVQHLVTADRDTKVSQMVGHSDAMSWPFATLMTSTAKSYEAGSRHTETWWKAGLRPGMVTDQTTGQKYVPAARDGNSIWSNFPTWSDTEPGHFARGGFLDLGGTELLADGVSLGEYGFYGQGFWDVPAAATNFELVYDLIHWQRGDYKWESPATAETRWKWNGPRRTRASRCRFSSRTTTSRSTSTTARRACGSSRSRSPPKPATGTRPAGSRRLESGRRTTTARPGQVPVVNLGTKVVALADNTKATDFVTLKTELTDSNGKSVTQTLNRFYKTR